jgi:hypothetical protein
VLGDTTIRQQTPHEGKRTCLPNVASLKLHGRASSAAKTKRKCPIRGSHWYATGDPGCHAFGYTHERADLDHNRH